MFNYDCMLSKKNQFFCGKGDNSNLNIDISKNTVSYELNYRYISELEIIARLTARDGLFYDRAVKNKI